MCLARYSEDEDWVQERLDTYCRLVARGDLCQGNCRHYTILKVLNCTARLQNKHYSTVHYLMKGICWILKIGIDFS